MYSFSYLEPVSCSMASSNCCFLTCIQISQETDKVVWYSHLLKDFPVCCVPHRYTHLNAEFQRIARRDKKAFLSNQCKEIEENNRMGKTRDLFKKMRDTKGTFHAKMGSINNRNGMDLTEAEDIRRGGKNTQKNCTKKIFMTKIITMV